MRKAKAAGKNSHTEERDGGEAGGTRRAEDGGEEHGEGATQVGDCQAGRRQATPREKGTGGRGPCPSRRNTGRTERVVRLWRAGAANDISYGRCSATVVGHVLWPFVSSP